MGLLDGFMPGESYGIPGGSQNKMQGLLSNPLLQIGLGILANNDSKNTGKVLGRGALAGMGNLQQQQQIMQQLAQQKQMDEMNQMRKLQLETEMAQQKKQADALDKFKTNNPQFADYADIDPKAAMKAANPTLGSNSADPFFQAIPTPQGLARFNARTGEMELITGPDGKPFMKSVDDIGLQTGIAAGKSYGENLYQPTDMQDGRITTKSQLAIDAGAPNLSQLPQIGKPQSMQIPPQVQNQRDAMRIQILMNEQASGGGAGVNPELDQEIANVSRQTGIAVPTKAQLAGQEAQAKANVELNMSPQIKGAEKSAEIAANQQGDRNKAIKTSDQLLNAAKQAKDLLDTNPTGSMVGAGVDTLGRAIGMSSDSAQNAAKLETLSGWMVANVPRMEGPQSNFDVDNYKTMAAKVGDRTVPVAERKAALDTLVKLQEKYKALNQTATGNAQPSKSKKPMKGQVVDGYKFKGGNPSDPNNWEEQ